MDKNLEKRILAWLFIIFIVFMGFRSEPTQMIDSLYSSFVNEEKTEENDASTENTIDEKLNLAFSSYVDSMKDKNAFIKIKGATSKTIGMKGAYSENGIYLANNNYIVSCGYNQTTTDYEIEQVSRLKQYLDEKGIKLLYVNAPIKYLDDSFTEENFGIESYSNQNADLFLSRLDEIGVEYIDLRDELVKDGMNSWDMFYRTDHHWNNKSGFWAATKIVDVLNKDYGYNIDKGIYDYNNYEFTEYNNFWLGEQGKKVSENYIGLDDYTLIKPKYDTSFTYKNDFSGVTKEGKFDVLIDYDRLYSEDDVENIPSLHYTYLQNGYHASKLINNNINEGKILLVGDSYSYNVIPFLGFGVSDIRGILLRDSNLSVQDWVDRCDIDTVIIVYAQFMIGAHDNINSANYKMFNLMN